MAEREMLIVDSHLDLGFCATQLNRDLTQPALTVRAHDSEPARQSFGSCTVTLPALRAGRVGIVFGTVMSRLAPNDRWTKTGMYCQDQCYGVGLTHFSYYLAMERLGQIRFIRSTSDLEETVAAWDDPQPDTPIGLVLAMESADPILDPDGVGAWYDRGLRMVSISHYGTSAYAHGTGTEGGLLPTAKPLLDALRAAGIIVDLTHTTDEAFWEILDVYDGPVAASHHNCRALAPGQRQLTDEMIRAIVERGGVIGAAFDVWMLDPQWKREVPCYEQTTKATMQTVANHIDHVCQIAGNARHAGIGTDLDGGFGHEQAPRDLNTIADLQRMRGILESRGYSTEDVAGILAGNWVRLLKHVWED